MRFILIMHKIIIFNFTAMFTVSDDSETPEISGGPLNKVYKFNQFHFHWGKL